jgi:hypothetical protein
VAVAVLGDGVQPRLDVPLAVQVRQGGKIRVDLGQDAAEERQAAGHPRHRRARPGAHAAFQVGDQQAAQRLGHAGKPRLPTPLRRGVLAGGLDVGAEVVEHRPGGVEGGVVVLERPVVALLAPTEREPEVLQVGLGGLQQPAAGLDQQPRGDLGAIPARLRRA